MYILLYILYMILYDGEIVPLWIMFFQDPGCFSPSHPFLTKAYGRSTWKLPIFTTGPKHTSLFGGLLDDPKNAGGKRGRGKTPCDFERCSFGRTLKWFCWAFDFCEMIANRKRIIILFQVKNTYCTIFNLGDRWGIFRISGPAMFNLTECIYYQGITFLPDPERH